MSRKKNKPKPVKYTSYLLIVTDEPQVMCLQKGNPADGASLYIQMPGECEVKHVPFRGHQEIYGEYTGKTFYLKTRRINPREVDCSTFSYDEYTIEKNGEDWIKFEFKKEGVFITNVLDKSA